MLRRLLLIALGLAAVVGSFVALRSLVARRSTDDANRIKALEARLERLEKQGYRSQVITRSLNSAEGHLALPAAAAGVAADHGSGAAAAARPKPPTVIDEVALQREYFGDLDVQLAGETRDPVWSAATEEKLRESAHDLRPRITVDNAQCGQTMCRVAATVPDPREDSAALDKFITASLDLLPEVVVHNGDGPGRHIVYFARQGSGFPPMNASEATAQ
jgi:hypothetical protein